jgi:hypothetical protein
MVRLWWVTWRWYLWWDAWSLRECKRVDSVTHGDTLHDGVVAFIANLMVESSVSG